jgi:hypothetical protein
VEANLLGGQSFTPLCNQALVLLPNRTDFSVQIESQRIYVAIIFAKRGIPVYLIGKAVPGDTAISNCIASPTCCSYAIC